MKNAGLFFLLVLLFVACDDDKKQVETLKKETMDIHDEAMADLGKMNGVSRQLKEFMAAALMLPEQAAQFTAALVAIEKADEDMMTWMSEYKDPENVSVAEAMRYLQEQKQKMQKNRDDIRAATEAGKKLLAQPTEQPIDK